MKIGILGIGRDCAEDLDKVLQPWYEAAKKHDIYFCFMSASFKGTENLNGPEPDQETITKLGEYAQNNPKTFFMMFDEYQKETVVRDFGRQILISENCDIIWMLDLSDEFYTEDQIIKIIKVIEDNPLTNWFKLSFKNYVFNKKTYLKESFQPPRIFRVKIKTPIFFALSSKELTLSKLWDDNNFNYQDDNGKEIKDIQLPFQIIPPSIAWIRHESWLSNERSKSKIIYQNARGWICSFKWNCEDLIGYYNLSFNPEYYKDKSLPEVVVED